MLTDEAKEADGTPVMKQWWDVTEADQKAIMDNTEWCMADNGYFRGGGYSSRYETRAQMPATMIRLNLVKGLGPVLADRRRMDSSPSGRGI